MNLYDLIIVGCGPAGIAAGIYSARQRIKTLIITKDFSPQITGKTVAIENYPGFESIPASELLQKFQNHLEKQKIEIEKDSVLNIEKKEDSFLVSTGNKKQYKALSIIIASGADPRPLEAPGEKEFIGKGVSYCVHCDGPFFVKKTIVIAGGGNSGFEAAIFMSNLAEKIYILEFGSKPAADIINQEMVEKIDKIEVITDAKIKEIKGNKLVESVIYEDRKTGKEKELKTSGVFIEIGLQPATSFVKDLVDFNERDEIIVDPKTSQTKIPGLFAAGDVDCVPYKQIVIAAGEGAKAAISVQGYLQKLKNAV